MSRNDITAERREQIITAMCKCLETHSFENTTIKMIATEAGLTPSLLHYYFVSKDEIILCVVERMLGGEEEQFIQQWLDSFDESTKPDIKVAMKELIRILFPKGKSTKKANVYLQVLAACAHSDVLKKEVNAHYNQILGKVAQALKKSCGSEETAAATAHGLQIIIEGITALTPIMDYDAECLCRIIDALM